MLLNVVKEKDVGFLVFFFFFSPKRMCNRLNMQRMTINMS